MKDYIGKECPYCNKKISFTDEVVSCSDCEAVHHKECWFENNGCTTKGCNGKIMKVSDIKNENIEIERIEKKSIKWACLSCGFENTIDSNFCSKCGAEINNNNQKYSELAKYIGKKSEYYIFNFKKMDNKKSEFSWNWAAFFLTMYWCFYRKLYTFGVVLFVLNIIHLTSPLFDGVNWIFAIVIPALLGGFGNSIYLKYIKNVADNKNEKKGGTEIYTALAAAVLLFIIVSMR